MLELKNISKQFDGKKVLDQVSLTIEQGTCVAILGPSGCGKSTLLNIISGILQPDEGQVLWNGEDLLPIPAHKRNFGLMFQEYALFPHMNVAENVCFGLEMKEMSQDAQEKRLKEMMDLVGLEGFEPRLVQQLSGGERQRVALARSLAPAPKLLLLDEPLGALDRSLRENLLSELQTILKNQTVVLVTHDQAEAFQLADIVYVLNQRKIVQQGEPKDLLEFPKTEFVARFLGYKNVFDAVYEKKSKSFQTSIGTILLADSISFNKEDGVYTMLLKSHCLTLVEPNEQKKNLFVTEGKIVAMEFHGKMMKIKVAVNDDVLIVEESIDLNSIKKGDFVSIWMTSRKAIVFLDENNQSNKKKS